jgi:hypothetical protein
MQINQINSNIPKKIIKNKQNQAQPNNNVNPAFKGGLDTFCLGVANAIENGGLFVSFTLQDMLGTNLPRPIMGLKRNAKENHGEKNTKFALKELIREMCTGPSMFLIPAGMLAVGKQVFGKTVDTPVKFIKSFGEIHAANPLNEAGKAISKQDFYKNTFTEIIKNAKSEAKASPETIDKATEFAQRLADSLKDKATKKETIGKLSDEFVNIAKQHATDPIHTDFTQAAVSKTTSASFKETVNHMLSYADDIVTKSGNQDTSKLTEYVKNLANKKAIGRFANNIVMYSAVLAFLQLIPKMYNKAEGKDNAGLKGLMKEETLNDKSLDNPQNSQVNAKNQTPTFGSSAKFVDTLTGSSLAGRMAQGIEFQGCNVSFPLLLGIMTFGILLPRTRDAKDKYDREEIVRRDLVTCATMCFAEKELRKGFSKLNETKSGLVLAAKDKGFKDQKLAKRVFDYLRPIKGVRVLSSEQIVSKYSNIDKYKDGIKGFCDFIDGQGGNLSKVFSLTDDSKSLVEKLLGDNIENADNETIKNTLSKAINSEEVQKLTELFKDKNNAWVQKARTLNARFTAFSVLVLVPAFLGFFLPWFNEKTTKKRIKEENEQNITQQNPQVDLVSTSFYNSKNNKVFADMTQY